MENQNQLYRQQAISPEQIGDDVLGVPEDVKKLREDIISVIEDGVDINIFPPAYQKKMKDYYRFAAIRYGSQYGKIAKRTLNTLDII